MSIKIFRNFTVILNFLLKYLCIFLLSCSSALDSFGYVTLDGYVYLPREVICIYMLSYGPVLFSSPSDAVTYLHRGGLYSLR